MLGFIPDLNEAFLARKQLMSDLHVPHLARVDPEVLIPVSIFSCNLGSRDSNMNQDCLYVFPLDAMTRM